LNELLQTFSSASTLNHITAVINAVLLLVTVFVTDSHFHPSLIFAGKVGTYPSGATYRTLLYGRPAFPANIRRLETTNTLAYYDMELITLVKCLIVHATVATRRYWLTARRSVALEATPNSIEI
jgi:hypothetical protein